MLTATLVLAVSTASAFDDKPVSDWISANAIRLKTPQAGNGFADMQPLKKVIGDARIVSLGEATHGTREFFQLKHRMMEFLATEMGFTIFSIEANMPEAYRLNDYVLHGKGDPKALLKGMYFWTWNTEEVLEMILWMREFNQSGKGRVEFTGFDMQTPTVALEIVRDFVAKNDTAYVAALGEASRIATSASSTRPGPNFGVATATFPVNDAAGKTIRFSGYIRTENITRGYAGLWWRVDGQSGTLAFDNMGNRGVTGTKDWERYSITLPVAKDAMNINFGAILTGDGTAWFDGLTVELDDKPYLDKTLFDLDFESGTPRGFYTGGNGYRVVLDSTMFRAGAKSLSMRHVAPAAAPSVVDPKIAVAMWKDVVEHLKSERSAYIEKKATDSGIDWVIQNANVVLQCMQMRSNEVSRDRSMAENVKWILDHSPKAKIVLWAHNGHVATSKFRGYEPMGATLREMYGDKMVVFGFAFNQGSFQAIEVGKALRDFTVPPAPAGTVDSTFAASGVPIFALDLRQTPAEGPVADWMKQSHKSRNIGAVFSDDSPNSYMSDLRTRESYDAMLFVAKTTAARKVLESQVQARGTEAGLTEYFDPDSSVVFKLPVDWKVRQTGRWGDQETTVSFFTPGTQAFASLYYRVRKAPEKLTQEQRAKKLADAAPQKVGQRRQSGLTDYTIKDGSCRTRTIGDRAAYSCIAEFSDRGAAMAEYLTWIDSDATNVLFFVRMPIAEIDAQRERMDPVIESIRFN